MDGPYSCVDGNCVVDPEGEYDNLGDCQQQCVGSGGSLGVGGTIALIAVLLIIAGIVGLGIVAAIKTPAYVGPRPWYGGWRWGPRPWYRPPGE